MLASGPEMAQAPSCWRMSNITGKCGAGLLRRRLTQGSNAGARTSERLTITRPIRTATCYGLTTAGQLERWPAIPAELPRLHTCPQNFHFICRQPNRRRPMSIVRYRLVLSGERSMNITCRRAIISARAPNARGMNRSRVQRRGSRPAIDDPPAGRCRVGVPTGRSALLRLERSKRIRKCVDADAATSDTLARAAGPRTAAHVDEPTCLRIAANLLREFGLNSLNRGF
jgi:hypothetical protein